MPKNSNYQVLKVISPTEIVVDLNKNKVEDKNELIELKNIQSFKAKPTESQLNLCKKLNINQEDSIRLGFLAENFAKELLSEKFIKLKNQNTTPIIIVNNKNYEDTLIKSGFAIKKGDKGSRGEEKNLALVQKNIIKAKKLNLVIFNNKSHKYHKLNCKYGLIAHNAQILPASQITKDSKPCKFCHSTKQLSNSEKQKTYKNYYDKIPDIKSPATYFKTTDIKIFLTDFTKVLKPSNSCSTDVCRALVTEIDNSKNSIDFAIYGYTKVPAIQKALEDAQKRGVKIRFVFDLDGKKGNIYPDTHYLAGILKNNAHDIEPSIMHDKFFVFDNKTVLTGSANISNTDMSGFNSNAVILINSEKVAQAYSQEFEQMYNSRFHKQKCKIKKDPIYDWGNSSELSVYFSPKDRPVTTQVIPLIDNAQKYIYMPVFLITHKALAESLIKASRRGVSVKIILDATNTHTASSKMKILRENGQGGIQVKTENFAGKLHSKSIIIDDLYTVIGSMNFSRSGEGANDENLIIIKNKEIALFYKTFFQYLWKRIPDYWLSHNARSESPDSIGSCTDGIDNDFDGKIDKADDSCKVKLMTKCK